MGKRLTTGQVVQTKYKLAEGLSDEFKDCFGDIEDSFTAIIYGNSGNGKTNFLVKLLKALKPVGNMLYVSYEEGLGKTIQDLILRHNLHEELPGLRFSDGETAEELMALLKKKRSPKVIVLDSWQFSGLTIDDYIRLKKQFVFGKTPGRRKIFLFISHVNGKVPDGKSALEIKRDANIKVLVEGFLAIIETSRYGGGKNIVVWEERAKQYWGKDYWKLTGQERPVKAKKAKRQKPAPEKSKPEETQISEPIMQAV